MTVTDAGALAAGGATLFGTAVLGAGALRIRGGAAFLVAAFVVGAAAIVFVTTALSLVGLYGRGPFLVAQLVVLMTVATVWLATGSPVPPRGRIPSRREAWQALRGHPAVALLGGAALFALVIEAVLAIFVVPNNFDSMTYHLARIAYWLQYASVLHFPGGSFRQLQDMPNAEILQGWTMLLSNGDRFAQLVQLVALVGTGVVVYLAARILRFSRAASTFAAALFMTLPEVVLESTTTQNDLVVAFFVASAAVFMVRAISSGSWGDAVIAATALGLALGTKGTVFLAGPGLLLITTAALLHWRPSREMVLGGMAMTVTAFLLLGATNYIQNTVDFSNPLGGASESDVTRHHPVPINAVWIGWSFVDFPGFGSPTVSPVAANADSWIVTAIQQEAQKLLGPDAENVGGGKKDGFPVEVDTTVSEDYTAFGPIGLVVLLPVLAVYALSWKSPPDRRMVALAAIAYMGAMALLLDANPWIMRLAITAVAIGAPLLARIEGIGWLRVITVLVAIFVLIPSLFLNLNKPLGFDHPLAFLEEDRITQQTVVSPDADALKKINSYIPADARIALIVGTGTDAWEYPYFGPHFGRYVRRIPEADAESIDPELLMRRQDFDAIVWTGITTVKPPKKAQHLGFHIYLLERENASARTDAREAPGRHRRALGDRRRTRPLSEHS